MREILPGTDAQARIQRRAPAKNQSSQKRIAPFGASSWSDARSVVQPPAAKRFARATDRARTVAEAKLLLAEKPAETAPDLPADNVIEAHE